VRQEISLPAIAGVAAGNQVFPGGRTAARAGDDVVQRQLAGGEDLSAVLAGVAVAQQYVLAGQCRV